LSRSKAYIFSIVAAIIVFLILTFHVLPLKINECENALYYLFSTISQSLAALFALVFTVMLVMIQIFKKYSTWKFITLFKTQFFLYTYAFAIVLPLILLRFNYLPLIIINFTIAYAIFCVLSLIPYFYGISQFMTGSFFFYDLERDILEACKIGSRSQANNLVDNFMEGWIEKIKSNDKDEWDEILKIWNNIQEKERDSRQIGFAFFRMQFSITLVYARKKHEEYARKIYNSLGINPLVYRVYFFEGNIKLFEIAQQNNLKSLSQDIVKMYGRAAVIGQEKLYLFKLLDMNKDYVKSILINEEMIQYLDGNRNYYGTLVSWMGEYSQNKL